MTIKYWGVSSLEIQLFPLPDAIREIADIATLRPTHWRIMVAWNYVAKNAGTRDWSTVDRVINEIASRGIQPLLIIGQGKPSWCSKPDRADEYGAFCTEVAIRYGTNGGGDPTISPFGKICTAFEIWNEENVSVFWGGSVNPTDYVASLVAGYGAIKAVTGLSGTGSTVIFGGLQPVPYGVYWFGQDWLTDQPMHFLQRCFDVRADLGNFFDVIGVHPYTDLNYSKSHSYEPLITQDCWLQVIQIRDFLAARGLPQKLWITEIGFSTALMTEAVQNTYMQQAWALVQTIPEVEMFIIYNARDHGTDLKNKEQNFGMMRYDFTHKPIWDWLVTLAPTLTVPPIVLPVPTMPVPTVETNIIPPPIVLPVPVMPSPTVPSTLPLVAFSSAGAGVRALSGSGSEAHTIGAGANCLIAGLVVSHGAIFHSDAYTTLQVLCGSTPMELVVSEDIGYFDSQPKGSTHLFALMDPPTGAQTISVTVVPPSGAIGSVMLQSAAYTGVGAIENVVSQQLHNHTLQLTVFSEIDGMPVCCAGFVNTPSGFNRTVRYSDGGNDFVGYRYMIMGDAPGNISVSFNASPYSQIGACGLNLKKAA